MRLLKSVGLGNGVGLVALLGAAMLGCGGSGNGPSRYPLEGAVQYKGQPVPYGEISLQPDSEKGNKGPGATAPIKDGRYSIPAQYGSIGGPHVVKITGFSGPPEAAAAAPSSAGTQAKGATRLFKEHTIQVELPRNAATQDFTIP